MNAPAENSWRCTVCGYVHQGGEGPEWCPICGAARSDFEAFTEAPVAAPQKTSGQWKCVNCGYLHAGSEAPEFCPLCGAPKDRFEPKAESEKGAAAKDVKIRCVVVGAGIAGLSAVESLRGTCPEAEITLVSREESLPYFRLNLTRYLAGEVTEGELPIYQQAWYEQQKVRLLLGEEVVALSLEDRTVALAGGESHPFDKLILTAGAHPFIPPLPGAQREGFTSLRTVQDAKAILDAAGRGGSIVCIGGGILGLETAGALARRGAKVTLLEGHGWLMPRQLNRQAAEMLEEHLKELGIEVRRKARAGEVLGDERVAGVRLQDGDTLPADMVLVTTGVRPNSFLARRAGLEVDQGVVVNNRLFTSHPDVLAAGDIAEHRGTLYGAWSPAQFQGSIAGMNAAGLDMEFGGIPRSNMLKVLGLPMLSIGRFEPEDGSYQVIESRENGSYFRFVFHDGCLAGAVLLGDTAITGPLKKAVETHSDFSGLLKKGPEAAEVVSHLKGWEGPEA